MATRPEQHGDVVLEVPVGPRQSNIVRHQKRTRACRTLALVQTLLGIAGLWFFKVENNGEVGIWLILPAFALGLVTDRWGVTEELWRKPSEAAARAAYRRHELGRNVVGIGVFAAFMAYVFWGPGGSVAWWIALLALIAANRALGLWAKRTHARWLERAPASEVALAIPPPFRY